VEHSARAGGTLWLRRALPALAPRGCHLKPLFRRIRTSERRRSARVGHRPSATLHAYYALDWKQARPAARRRPCLLPARARAQRGRTYPPPVLLCAACGGRAGRPPTVAAHSRRRARRAGRALLLALARGYSAYPPRACFGSARPSFRRAACDCDRARTHACTCAACPGGRWGLRLRLGAGWMDGGVRVRRRAPGLPPGQWPPAEQSKRSSMDGQIGAGQPRRASSGASGLGYHLVLRELSGSSDITSGTACRPSPSTQPSFAAYCYCIIDQRYPRPAGRYLQSNSRTRLVVWGRQLIRLN